MVPATPASACLFALSLIALVTGPSLFLGEGGVLEVDFGSFCWCVGNRTALRAFSVCGPVGRYLGSRRPIYAHFFLSARLHSYPRDEHCLRKEPHAVVRIWGPALTILNNLHTVSLGWAPTPNQY